MGPGQDSVESSDAWPPHPMLMVTSPAGSHLNGRLWKAILWLVLGVFHSCWLKFFPFLLKINPIQPKAAKKNLNEIVASEDLTHSKLVSRGAFLYFPGFKQNPIQPQKQQRDCSPEPAFSGGLSRMLLSLLGSAPPYGKEARHMYLLPQNHTLSFCF